MDAIWREAAKILVEYAWVSGMITNSLLLFYGKYRQLKETTSEVRLFLTQADWVLVIVAREVIRKKEF
jgi:hypothetical protein